LAATPSGRCRIRSKARSRSRECRLSSPAVSPARTRSPVLSPVAHRAGRSRPGIEVAADLGCGDRGRSLPSIFPASAHWRTSVRNSGSNLPRSRNSCQFNPVVERAVAIGTIADFPQPGRLMPDTVHVEGIEADLLWHIVVPCVARALATRQRSASRCSIASSTPARLILGGFLGGRQASSLSNPMAGSMATARRLPSCSRCSQPWPTRQSSSAPQSLVWSISA
jgi:hypothetical protein